MPTRLSRYCAGIMEAAWLCAVIVVPVFFNVFSSRIFEPDKISILRSLALLILAAWLIKLVEEGGARWETIRAGEAGWRGLLRIPMVLPVIALAVVYTISTVFSISPGVSFWGSYQRLQGTYTTFSYLVVFAAILGNLRSRSQVERLVTAVILSSLPVSFYGVLQRFKLDPIPWGGDVSSRVAANLGNSIFIAAYLIMVFPLVVIRIVTTFTAILKENTRLLQNFSKATLYVFIAVMELIAIYLSGSRGPWLGLAASVVFLGLVLSLVWRKRWLTLSGVGVALVAAVFLIVLNIPNGPLQSLRSLPGVGRLGTLLDAESRTGRVRELIWQGASDLVRPHAPLQFPDGRVDNLNALRPLIGYGPESMYVAYNPFYPPDLTQVEKRNASPDRSHNETWDSLVVTGVLGLAVYLFLFGSVFYFGLKWLGLIKTRRQRRLFFGLLAGGGVVSAAVLTGLKGIAYFGVGLPFGIVLGLLTYLILVALFGSYDAPETDADRLRSLLIVGLLAVVVAHFVEINFGIAIGVTRLYFWAFSALMVVLGYVFPATGEYERWAAEDAARTVDEVPGARSQSQKKKRRATRAAPGVRAMPGWLRGALLAAGIMAILMVTLGYDYITNMQGGRTAIDILLNSLTSVRGNTTFGILALILVTWLAGAIVFASESRYAASNAAWLKIIVVVLGSSLLVGLVFWLLQAGALAALTNATSNTMDDVIRLVGQYEGLLTRYYAFLALIVLGLAVFLPLDWPARLARYAWAPAALAPLALLVAIYLAATTNLGVIQADIAFKLADPFTRTGQWQVGIQIYQRANAEAPSEDYYYLFLGRAYLEQAKTLQDPTERDNLIEQAIRDLTKAQAISPLNTDHTANLARVYSLWSSYTNDPQLRQQRAATSASYFEKATTLSPNNAQLWDEWALLALNIQQDYNEANRLLTRSLTLDPYYDWSYGLMGDVYARGAQAITDTVRQAEYLQKSAEYYNRALELVGTRDNNLKYSYALALGGLEAQRDQPVAAINAYQQALDTVPNGSDSWRVLETIARLYSQNGDTANGLKYAQMALDRAPDDQKDRLRQLVDQMQSAP